MKTYTVWVCEAGGSGTTHIQAYTAENETAAAEAALDQVQKDWGDDDRDNLHILGIALGDVTIMEWNDINV